MTRDEELAWWKVVLLHEAGHAVVSIVRYKLYHAITAQNDPDGGRAGMKASYQHKLSPFDAASRPDDFVLVTCGGAAAERLVLDQNSEGFAGDRARLKGQSFMTDGQRETLERLADAEINGGFPATTAVLRTHRRALEAIADAALKQFAGAGFVGSPFLAMTVLTAEDVERLFHENPPSLGTTAAGATSSTPDP